MPIPFFPDSLFGWVFYALLVLVTLCASYTDLRWFVVPKWISVAGLALGLVANLLRGALLGWQGSPVWALETNGILIGACDGVLFGLAGFALGFGLFFAMWVLGICGGGDVKLFAAVSTWVGPRYALWLLGGCTAIMLVFAVLRIIGSFLSDGSRATIRSFASKKVAGAEQKKPLSRLSTYALPLGISTAVLMLWFYRYDLNLMDRVPQRGTAPMEGAIGHAQKI